MGRLLDALAGLSFLLLGAVLASVRREHLRVEYSVSWLGACLALLILSRNNSLLEWLAELLGIDYPPVALLLVVLAVFLVVFYRFTILVSDLKEANVALAQKVAILEYRVREMQGHEPR